MITLSRAAVAFLCLLAPAAEPAGAARPPLNTPALQASGTHSYSLDAAGFTWNCTVHVPAGYDPTRAVPLVLILHGAGGSGALYLSRCGWAAKADQAGFIALAPDGLPARPRLPQNFLTNPRVWNSGQLEGPRARIDDVAFLRALVADAQARWKVDVKRIYLTGHSNGAAMTFRLAAEYPQPFAAIAPVAGQLWVHDVHPAKPLPTLFIVGTQDPLQPLKGGESRTPWGARITPPIADSLARWATAIGCRPGAKVVQQVHGLTIQEWTPGPGGAVLRANFIDGQGHGWPGGDQVLPARFVGPSVNTVNATDMIWQFFAARPGQE